MRLWFAAMFYLASLFQINGVVPEQHQPDHTHGTMWAADILDANAPRRNLFFLLNAGDSTIVNKNGAAFDIYPTILEAMGYELKNGRGNMGVSLLSDRPSMASQYGVVILSSGIEGNRRLAHWLWRNSDAPSR